MEDTMVDEQWQQAQLVYTSKINTAARNSYYKIPGYAVEDIEQELLVVLWESIKLYDPNKGATFNTFFWMRAKQKIGMLIRKYAEMKMRKATLVSLEEEAVQAAVEEIMLGTSAEDLAMCHLEIQERWAKLPPQRRQKYA